MVVAGCSGRGPKHVVTKGATPVLSPAEARRLLEATDTEAHRQSRAVAHSAREREDQAFVDAIADRGAV